MAAEAQSPRQHAWELVGFEAVATPLEQTASAVVDLVLESSFEALQSPCLVLEEAGARLVRGLS